MIMPTCLTPHFTLEELTISQTALRLGIDNTPSAEILANLTRLCETILEPIRSLLGARMTLSSGYRSVALNQAIGGSPTSYHCLGLAADWEPFGVPLDVAFALVRRSTLPLDLTIYECQAWVHTQAARAGVTPRDQALIASGGPGAWVYTPVA
jgi:zinc D-Ala-D-Ala carboxypeptidase